MTGTLRQLAPQRWQLRVYLGRDASGRVQQVNRNFEGGKRAAEKALAELVASTGAGGVVKHSCSVAELLDRWLTHKEATLTIAIGAVTGARRGELCALRWSHIDWERHTLTVEQSLTRLKGNTTVGDTKTHQWRTLALDEALETLLRAWRATQEKYAREVGVGLVTDAYILSLASDGSAPCKPDSLGQAYKRVARRVGITSHLHELRHFAATTAIASGTDLRTVSARLGHAQTSTTLDIYAAALEQRDRELAGVLGNAVLGPVDGGQEADTGDAPPPPSEWRPEARPGGRGLRPGRRNTKHIGGLFDADYGGVRSVQIPLACSLHWTCQSYDDVKGPSGPVRSAAN